MKNDPVEKKLRELAWRRELTETEQAELRAWLAVHPEAKLEWQSEAELSTLLSRLPDVPVSSNFTARVLQAVERESQAPAKVSAYQGWWSRLLPRAAMVALVMGVALIAFEHHQSTQRRRMVQSLAVVANAEPFSNPAMFEDFETIRRLAPSTAPDKDLLALFQ